MKKQTRIFFYLLGIYVVLQFAWWNYHLIELTEELEKEPAEISRKIRMIFSEGVVFFLILMFGLWKIRLSIKKELQLSQRQTNFLLSVTHELKTPLASIKLFLQTLQKHELDKSKRDDLIEKAMNENDRLEGMIDNILNASRLENNALKPIKTNINISELLHQLADRLEKRYQLTFINRNIGANIYKEVDSFFIETMLNNLVENAVKYAGIHGKIRVNLFQKDTLVIFSVTDEGPGIPIDDQDAIFTKFFRSGNEEVRQQKGSGLGLFIVGELAKMHNGKVVYRKNEPKGSNFEVTL
jgi:signal transduction histidine kinase